MAPAGGDPVRILWRRLMLIKLVWLRYRMVKKLWRYVKPFSSSIGALRTDGQTDGRAEFLYQYNASVCWRAIKTRWRWDDFQFLDMMSAVLWNSYFKTNISEQNWNLVLEITQKMAFHSDIFVALSYGRARHRHIGGVSVRPSLRLSVRPSITRWYWLKTKDHTDLTVFTIGVAHGLYFYTIGPRRTSLRWLQTRLRRVKTQIFNQ